MAAEQYANDATGQLLASISPSDVSATLISASAFLPLTGPFRVRIDNELIQVGSRSGSILNGLVRGIEGTTAAAHSPEASVLHVLTAGALQTIAQQEAAAAMKVLGGGDSPYLYVSTRGQYVDVTMGTALVPNTSGQPAAKFAQTVAVNPVGEAGNNIDRQPAVLGISHGVTGNAIQVTGGAFIAINDSTTADFRNDSVGLYGYGEIRAVGSTNSSAGGFLATRRTIATVFSGGCEFQMQNLVVTGSQIFGSAAVTFDTATDKVLYTAHGLSDGDLIAFTTTGTLPTGMTASVDGGPHLYYVINSGADVNSFQISETFGGAAVDMSGAPTGVHTAYPNPGSAYNPNTYTRAVGLSISAGGLAHGTMVGLGISFGRGGAGYLDVGIGVPAFPLEGNGRGPIRHAVLRDDAGSEFTILVTGTKRISPIAVAAGVGPVILGKITPAIGNQIGTKLVVADTVGSTTQPMMYIGNSGSTLPHIGMHFETAGSRLQTFLCGAPNNFFSGTGTGDFGMRLLDAGKTYWMAGASTGLLIGWSEDGNIRLGTVATQKIGFWGTTPVVRPANNRDLRLALIDVGLYASGGATPLDLNGGNLTLSNANIVAGTGAGMQIGTANTQKLALWGKTPVVQPAAYTLSGASVSRSYTKQTFAPTNDGAVTAFDADATSEDEMADVLGTLARKFNALQDFVLTLAADIQQIGAVG